MYLNRQRTGHLTLAAAKAHVLESYLETRVVEIAISSSSKDTPVTLLWQQQSARPLGEGPKKKQPPSKSPKGFARRLLRPIFVILNVFCNLVTFIHVCI